MLSFSEHPRNCPFSKSTAPWLGLIWELLNVEKNSNFVTPALEKVLMILFFYDVIRAHNFGRCVKKMSLGSYLLFVTDLCCKPNNLTRGCGHP